MARVQFIKWYIGAELNIDTKTVTRGNVAIGSTFMDAITRVRLIVYAANGAALATIDTDNPIPAGTIDFSTGAASSQINFALGKYTDEIPAAGTYSARLDIFQGADNAVIAHDAEQDLRVMVFDEVA